MISLETIGRLALVVALLLPVACSSAPEHTERPRKKLIQAGWGQPTPAYLRLHWEEMEATTPFDGVVIGVDVAAPNGKRCNCMTIWQDWRWERAWFDESLRDLQSCQFRRFTDNCLRVCATPGTAD